MCHISKLVTLQCHIKLLSHIAHVKIYLFPGEANVKINYQYYCILNVYVYTWRSRFYWEVFLIWYNIFSLGIILSFGHFFFNIYTMMSNVVILYYTKKLSISTIGDFYGTSFVFYVHFHVITLTYLVVVEVFQNKYICMVRWNSNCWMYFTYAVFLANCC